MMKRKARAWLTPNPSRKKAKEKVHNRLQWQNQEIPPLVADFKTEHGGVDTENSGASLTLKDLDGGDFALRKLLWKAGP